MNILCVNAFENRRGTITAELRRYGREAIFVDAPRETEAALQGWMPCPSWRDPCENRLMSWGELACMAGHAMAWKIAAGNPQGAVIIEDDIRLHGDPLDFEPRGDLVYLSRKFMRPAGPVEDGLIRAPYTYWLNAYWISPGGALELLRAVDRRQSIPADEFVPYHFGRNPNVRGDHRQAPPVMLEAWALPGDGLLASPSGRWPSATQASEPAYELRTAVWAAGTGKARGLTDSLDRHGWAYEVLIAGKADRTRNRGYKGGILKLSSLADWIDGLDQSNVRAVVCALDGDEVRALAGPQGVLQRYGEMSAEIVVGAELNCRPDKDLAPKLESCLPRPGAWLGENKDKAIYRYPNTGTMIGMADSVKRVVRQACDEEVSSLKPSDKSGGQQAIQRQIIRDARGWRLDREAYLFQTLADGAAAHMEHDNGVPRNRITTCRPAFLHATGCGAKAADVLDRAGPRACPPMAEFAGDAGEWQVLGPEIVGMPFLSPRSARALAEAAHAAPGWQPLPGDNVPGDELRLKSFDAGRAAQVEEAVNMHLASMVGSFWRPAKWPGVGDQFFIRYAPGRQPSLRLHEDNSCISCSIKLRAACGGGVLWFPRQNFTDENIPVGWLIAWPSRITHPHRVMPVSKGRRMSIVVWSH